MAHDACGGVDGDVVGVHLLWLRTRLRRGPGSGGFGNRGMSARSVRAIRSGGGV